MDTAAVIALKFLKCNGPGEGNTMIRKRTREPFTSEIGAKGCVAGVGEKFQRRTRQPIVRMEEATTVPRGKKGLPPVNILTKSDGEADAMRRVCGFGE